MLLTIDIHENGAFPTTQARSESSPWPAPHPSVLFSEILVGLQFMDVDGASLIVEKTERKTFNHNYFIMRMCDNCD